jgi:hypothetical protein
VDGVYHPIQLFLTYGKRGAKHNGVAFPSGKSC